MKVCPLLSLRNVFSPLLEADNAEKLLRSDRQPPSTAGVKKEEGKSNGIPISPRLVTQLCSPENYSGPC